MHKSAAAPRPWRRRFQRAVLSALVASVPLPVSVLATPTPAGASPAPAPGAAARTGAVVRSAQCEGAGGLPAELGEWAHELGQGLELASAAAKTGAKSLGVVGDAAGAEHLSGLGEAAGTAGEVAGYGFALAAYKAATNAFDLGAKDPAAPDFEAMFTPVFASVPVVEAPAPGLAGAFKSLNRLFATEVRFAEVVVAYRTSLDRAGSAAAAGDQLWLQRQADASAKYALEASTVLKGLPRLDAAVESNFVADRLALAITPQQFRAGQAQVARHGLPSVVTHLLGVAAGALRPQANAEVKALKALLLDTTALKQAILRATPTSLDLQDVLGPGPLSAADDRAAAAFQGYAARILVPTTTTTTTTKQAQIRTFAMGCAEGGGGASSGLTWGDPHLVTLNGFHYDFQGAGEFTLVRSDDGSLDIQVRQQPQLALSDEVSFDTAVAMLVAGTRVEVDPGLALGILVDGHPLQLNGAADHLRGGGELYYDPVGDVVVKWPDGSKAVIYAAGIGGYVVFTAAADLAGKLKGLLTAVAKPEGAHGIPDGDEVLIGGNGKQYVVNTNATSPPPTLYREFGPSWQITPRESLFTYPRGKSTSSYILKNFPDSGYDLASLPEGRLADIKSTCRKAGVTNADLLEDCVYDSAATGRPAGLVAALAARAQTVVTAAEQGAGTAPNGPTTVPLGTGGSLPVTAADPTTGTTYVAWATDSGDAIDLCVVVTTSLCNATGDPDRLTDGTIGAGGPPQYSDPRIVIMPGSGQVVVLAAVVGVVASEVPKVDPPGYTGSAGDVAWASAPGGTAFGQPGEGIQDGGVFLAAGVPPEAGAVALSPTAIGVFENDTYQSAFSDFTLATPAPVTPADPDPTGGFGQSANSNSGQLAAQPVASPAGDDVVVGIALGGDDPSCPTSLTTVGWGSATGSLVQAGSAGALNDSATWPSRGFKLLACAAGSPTLASGPSGIGELDQEGPGLAKGTQLSLVFRRFDVATGTFGAPVQISDETKVSSGGAANVSLSQDSTGSIYAAWVDNRGLVVSWSSDGGAHWSVPGATGLALNSTGNDFVVQGLGAGKFAVAYDKAVPPTTAREYLTTFNYSALRVPPSTTSPTAPTQ